MSLSYAVLTKQDAECSTTLIADLDSNANFVKLSEFEGKLTLDRDMQDGEKLQKGIDFAKEKGIIDPDFVPEEYITIDVLGKVPDEVSDIMLNKIKEKGGDQGDGLVIVLCGLSGTGKGTTMEVLRQKLVEKEKKKVVTWSNGNIFRSATLLAVTWCEQNGCDAFDADKALTKENLESFMNMLSFDKYNDKYDTKIVGLGIDACVSEIQNTELKSSKVSKNIPTVAQSTQGEVIMFASKAIDILSKAGIVVLLEGREQTVNYVRTPHRFTLTLSDATLIGKRRAAQRLAAKALASSDLSDKSTNDDVKVVLEKELDIMVNEIE